jgi:hypothetical protein
MVRKRRTEDSGDVLLIFPPAIATVVIWLLLGIDLADVPDGLLEVMAIGLATGAVWGALVRVGRARAGRHPA